MSCLCEKINCLCTVPCVCESQCIGITCIKADDDRICRICKKPVFYEQLFSENHEVCNCFTVESNIRFDLSPTAESFEYNFDSKKEIENAALPECHMGTMSSFEISNKSAEMTKIKQTIVEQMHVQHNQLEMAKIDGQNTCEYKSFKQLPEQLDGNVANTYKCFEQLPEQFDGNVANTYECFELPEQLDNNITNTCEYGYFEQLPKQLSGNGMSDDVKEFSVKQQNLCPALQELAFTWKKLTRRWLSRNENEFGIFMR